MSKSIFKAYLLDVTSGAPVEAEVRRPIEDGDLRTWEQTWAPDILSVVQRLATQGVPASQWPQSSHWNWTSKVNAIQGLLGQDTYSLWAQGRLQGLLQVNLTKASKCVGQLGKPLVYVEYIETAPWNRGTPFSGPLLSGVGTILMAIALNRSIDEEFKGRLGLHSLPPSEQFYRDRCGMTDLGPDENYQNLRYFEATAEQAQKLAALLIGES